MKWLGKIIGSKGFQIAILVVIGFNAIVLGVQTSAWANARFGGWLSALDKFCLAVFVIELILKILVYNRRFCRDPWNLFDFAIVAVSLMPTMGALSSARVFRVLRIFKLVSGVRQMRVILSAILKSIPGIMWAGSLLALIYYVYGIIGTLLFGKVFPDWFGSLGASVYSLFQIMTLESWSMGIARPVIAQFPYAWIFFVSYILLSSFVVMNIVVGIVLTSIGDSFKHEEERENKDSGSDLAVEFEKLKRQLEVVEAAIEATSKGKGDKANER